MMTWFALVPGFVLCAAVFGLLVYEWLDATACGSEGAADDVPCPLCRSFEQEAFADNSK